MIELKCITWNVRGLRAKSKWNAVLSYLKAQRADLILLVETHLTGQLQMALVLLTLRSDPQGRFLFLHAKLNGLELLILAIYIPPPFQFNVITEGKAFMSQFPTVPAIWLGDFNNVVNGKLDRLSITPHDHPPRLYTRFGRLLSDLTLVD